MRWHYTTYKHHLPKILAAGYIDTTRVGIDEGELAAAWFSTDPYFEPTARKMYSVPGQPPRELTMDEMHQYAGLVRIGVADETAPVSWAGFRVHSGATKKTIKRLTIAGRKHGANPDNWFASFEPVPRDTWLSIQKWNGTGWVDLDRSEWEA